MGLKEHHRTAPSAVAVGLITVSDSRTEATDESGRLCAELCEKAGHHVAARRLVPDDPALVRAAIEEMIAAAAGVQAILVNGGTGISRRDRTFEAVSGMLEGRLDGFGELFRALSYQEIGSAALLSRALGGIAAGRVVLALPGSRAAIALAMEKLVLPELGHLAAEAVKTR